MKQELYSFQKPQTPRISKAINIPQLLKEDPIELSNGWQFVGHLLEQPSTIIVDGEIRQITKMCQVGEAQTVITVILGEEAVRKYCNLLKPGQNFRIKNGVLKVQFFSKNYILLTQNSQITVISYFQQDSNSRNGASTKSKKPLSPPMTPVSLKIPNQIHKQQIRPNRSERIEVTTKQAGKQIQLIDLMGKVLCSYRVGAEKMNHGIGYQVQAQDGKKWEVVVWAEVGGMRALMRGRRYIFRNFRLSQRGNYGLSLHSHFQSSCILELD